MFGRRAILPPRELCPETRTYETEPWIHYLNVHIPLLHGQALENIKQAQVRQKRQYDKTKTTKYDYKPGDLEPVRMQNSFTECILAKLLF
ncbi:hypothetical protein BJV82DRAFT_524235 [Fennellomyces sp. T-0311]|nr:hypothetical protein BJV82DRAFT_524235 [Fennellomyces sp. T-0311]